jgi:DNA modification methylase
VRERPALPNKTSRRPQRHLARDGRTPKRAYRTGAGIAYHSTVESFLASAQAARLRGKVALILTSPPFPLNRKKRYGNLQGQDYLSWLERLAPKLVELLRPNGSVVIEIGNAWEPGKPEMSTLPTKSLLAFLAAGQLRLCQEFIGYNKARIPAPAQWVNIDRIRVKDAYTHIWWMSRSPRPTANNRRVLQPYSSAMLELLKTGKYNHGRRPSEYVVNPTSFNTDNGGSIPPNVIEFANTSSRDDYLDYCGKKHLETHPARMNAEVASFFVKFLTGKGSLVLDPFAGSNTTGAVAQSLGRRWVAVERDARYLRGSKGRFSSAARGVKPIGPRRATHPSNGRPRRRDRSADRRIVRARTSGKRQVGPPG